MIELAERSHFAIHTRKRINLKTIWVIEYWRQSCCLKDSSKNKYKPMVFEKNDVNFKFFHDRYELINWICFDFIYSKVALFVSLILRANRRATARGGILFSKEDPA